MQNTHEDGSSFTVDELIRKEIQTNLIIQRHAMRHVIWNRATEEISCSCNGLVCRGMPCTLIALIAKTKEYKIPLSLFNPRFCYLSPVAGPAEPVQPANPPPPPSSEQHLHPSDPSDEVRTEVVRGSELHITESFMSEHFGDERSIRVRGEMRAIEILLLDEITPFVTDDDLTETMSEIRRLLERKAERLK